MAVSRTRAWLHRIGYVTTAIVVLQLIVIVVIGIRVIGQEREIHARIKESVRTHEGLLREEEFRYGPGFNDLLEDLPPLTEQAERGFRFVAIPALRDRSFAYSLTLSPDADRAQGILLAYDLNVEEIQRVPEYRINFSISTAAGEKFLERFDALTRDWPGDDTLCLDGTGVGFELQNGNGIMSGKGDSECSQHYREVGLLALEPVWSLIPAGHRPMGGNWRPAEDAGAGEAGAAMGVAE